MPRAREPQNADPPAWMLPGLASASGARHDAAGGAVGPGWFLPGGLQQSTLDAIARREERERLVKAEVRELRRAEVIGRWTKKLQKLRKSTKLSEEERAAIERALAALRGDRPEDAIAILEEQLVGQAPPEGEPEEEPTE